MTPSRIIQAPEASEGSRLWDLALNRNFPCAGRLVNVAVSALRTESRELYFTVTWQPNKPVRLTGEDMAAFDRAKRAAIAELRAAYEALP